MRRLNEIREALRVRGVKIRVSEISGVDQGQLSRICRGVVRNPGIDVVERIDAALDALAAGAATGSGTGGVSVDAASGAPVVPVSGGVADVVESA